MFKLREREREREYGVGMNEKHFTLERVDNRLKCKKGQVIGSFLQLWIFDVHVNSSIMHEGAPIKQNPST
jgi:hypothetical protein